MKAKIRKDGTFRVTITQDEIDTIYDALRTGVAAAHANLSALSDQEAMAVVTLDLLSREIEPLVSRVLTYVDGIRYTADDERAWIAEVNSGETVQGFSTWLGER